MIDAPTNWDALWALEDTVLEIDINVHYYQVNLLSSHQYYGMNAPGASLTIDFTNSDLANGGVTVEHMSSDNTTVGNANAAQLTFTLVDPGENAEFLRERQQISLYVRLRNGNTTTQWVPQGMFFIDSINVNRDGSVDVTAYDPIYINGERKTTYNTSSTFKAIFNTGNIVGNIGMNSTAINDERISGYEFSLDYRTSKVSYNELCSVAAAYAGADMIVNKHAKLELIDIGNNVSVTDEPLGYVVTAESVYSATTPTTVGGIRVKSGETVYDDWFGSNLSVDYPELQNPSSEVAATIYSNMLAKNNNRVYICGTEVYGAVITPLLEIGDIVSVLQDDGKYFNFKLHGYRIQYAGYCYGELQGGINERYLESYSYSGSWKRIHASEQSPTVRVIGDRMFSISPIVFDNDVVSPSSPPYPSIVRLNKGILGYFTATCLMKNGNIQTVSMRGYQMDGYFPLYDSITSPQEGIAANSYYVKDVQYASYSSLANIQEVLSAELVTSRYGDVNIPASS